MDHRLERNFAIAEREALKRDRALLHEQTSQTVHRFAADRLLSGRKLRPCDASQLAGALKHLYRVPYADVVEMSQKPSLAAGSLKAIVATGTVATAEKVTDGETEARIEENAIALGTISIDWTSKRLLLNALWAFVDVSEHAQRRFMSRSRRERVGVAELGYLLRMMPLAFAMAAEGARLDGDTRHDTAPSPVFVPHAKGMWFGTITRQAMPGDAALARQERAVVGGRRAVSYRMPPLERRLCGVSWVVPADGALWRTEVTRIATFVDDDALGEEQTQFRDALASIVGRHGPAMARAIDAAYFAIEPAAEPDCGPLRREIRELVQSPLGRSMVKRGLRSWEGSNHGKLGQPAGDAAK
ncbi:MAG: hypothetical protein IBJ15_00095 [Alphaproteobacteria bacterium]|nr:hypothetical protein [Alphaproteobacteria bacterium]